MSIVTNGLVGYWHYAQGLSGTTWQNIAPTTQGQYDGTLKGGASLVSDGVNFDGTSGYVSIGTFSPLVNLNTFTYQVLLTAPVDTTARYFFTLYTDGSNRSSLGYNTSKLPWLAFITSGSNHALNGIGSAITTDILLTVTVDGSNGRKLYVNTTLNASDTNISTQPSSINQISIGALLAGSPATASSFFSGKIRAVRIYNRALTTAEITQNYNVANNDVGLTQQGTIGSSNIDTRQKIYQTGTTSFDTQQNLLPISGSISFDTQQNILPITGATSFDTQQNISASVGKIDYIKIYKAIDNSIVSPNGVFDNPIEFNLNINNNESQQQRLYVANDPNYTLSNITIQFQGTTSDKWQVASDNNGSPFTFGTTLSLGSLGGIAGNKKYFWIKAISNNTETIGNDNSVILNVTGNASYF